MSFNVCLFVFCLCVFFVCYVCIGFAYTSSWIVVFDLAILYIVGVRSIILSLSLCLCLDVVTNCIHNEIITPYYNNYVIFFDHTTPW